MNIAGLMMPPISQDFSPSSLRLRMVPNPGSFEAIVPFLLSPTVISGWERIENVHGLHLELSLYVTLSILLISSTPARCGEICTLRSLEFDWRGFGRGQPLHYVLRSYQQTVVDLVRILVWPSNLRLCMLVMRLVVYSNLILVITKSPTQ